MLGEIERRVVCLPVVLERNALSLERNPRNIFFVEEVGNLKPRMLELSFGLADQMIDLRRGDARNFVFDRAEPTGADRQFSFAVERKQSALAFDLNFARQRRDIDDGVVVFAQRIITKRTHTFFYPDVEFAIALNADAKRMLSILRLFRWQRHIRDRPRVVQDIVRNIGGAFPKLCLLDLRPDRFVVGISFLARRCGIFSRLIDIFRAFNLRLFFSF